MDVKKLFRNKEKGRQRRVTMLPARNLRQCTELSDGVPEESFKSPFSGLEGRPPGKEEAKEQNNEAGSS